MRDEKITHICTISWGMFISNDPGKYIESLIDKKKHEVAIALELAGFDVIDQHFIHDCEWGTLYTWAELIENPANITAYRGDRKIEYGYFYDPEKQRQFLNLRKMNKESHGKN